MIHPEMIYHLGTPFFCLWLCQFVNLPLEEQYKDVKGIPFGKHDPPTHRGRKFDAASTYEIYHGEVFPLKIPFLQPPQEPQLEFGKSYVKLIGT